MSLHKHGPFYEQRQEITKDLKSFLKTGDVIFRQSDAKFLLFIPFSKLVSWLSNSKYSHATIILVEENEVYAIEINDKGTSKMRIIEWLDFCIKPGFAIYRVKTDSESKENNISKLLAYEIYRFLNKDPDYDFTFDNPEKFYCTESVVTLYDRSGIKICEPQKIKDVIKPWQYSLLKPINNLIKFFTGKGLPLEIPLYFVGNDKQGMMSSSKLRLIKEIELSYG